MLQKVLSTCLDSIQIPILEKQIYDTISPILMVREDAISHFAIDSKDMESSLSQLSLSSD